MNTTVVELDGERYEVAKVSTPHGSGRRWYRSMLLRRLAPCGPCERGFHRCCVVAGCSCRSEFHPPTDLEGRPL